VQIKKVYGGLNPEMLVDVIRSLLQKQGIAAIEIESQTYGLPSGGTQSRAILALRTEAVPGRDQSEYGSAHILSSQQDEVKVLLDIDDALLPPEKLVAFQEDLNFILSSYEVKW
jgi:hypothetical protein